MTMTKKIIGRLKNWKTTVCGVFFGILAVALLFTNKATFAEVTPFFVLCAIGLGLKDSVFNGNINIKILVIGLLLTFASCKTPQKKLEQLITKNPELIKQKEFEFVDTLITEGIDNVIILPANTFDSIGSITFVKDKVNYEITKTNGFVSIKVNKPPDTTYVPKKITYDYIEIKELSFWQKNKEIIIGLSIVCFLILLISALKKFINEIVK